MNAFRDVFFPTAVAVSIVYASVGFSHRPAWLAAATLVAGCSKRINHAAAVCAIAAATGVYFADAHGGLLLAALAASATTGTMAIVWGGWADLAATAAGTAVAVGTWYAVVEFPLWPAWVHGIAVAARVAAQLARPHDDELLSLPLVITTSAISHPLLGFAAQLLTGCKSPWIGLLGAVNGVLIARLRWLSRLSAPGTYFGVAAALTVLLGATTTTFAKRVGTIREANEARPSGAATVVVLVLWGVSIGPIGA